MSAFLIAATLRAQIPELTYCETYVLLNMSLAADDGSNRSSTSTKRDHQIGDNVDISINKIAKMSGFDRSSLNKAVKSLIQKGYITLAEERNSSRKRNKTTNTYHVNVSKIIRVLDYQKTVQVLNLDIDDEYVQKFYQSAIRTYEDDYSDPPFTSLEDEEHGICIQDWDDLVEAGDDALERFWRTYREKSTSADNNTETLDDKRTPSDHPVEAAGRSSKRFSIDVYLQEHE